MDQEKYEQFLKIVVEKNDKLEAQIKDLQSELSQTKNLNVLYQTKNVSLQNDIEKLQFENQELKLKLD